MSRRKIRTWSADELVSASTVAPDRYNDPDYDGSAIYLAKTWQEHRDAMTYKVGEVVWIEHYGRDGTKAPKKARIVDWINSRDKDGWRRECYVVQYETLKGVWAKVGEKTWPGYIERGYQLAATLFADAANPPLVPTVPEQ